MSTKLRAYACGLMLVLAACAGGGGGGGGGIDTPPAPAAPSGPPAFTSFSAIEPGGSAVLSGISQNADVTYTDSSNDVVTSFTARPVDTSAKVTLGYDANQQLSAVKIESGQTSMAFSRDAGDTITCANGACQARNAAQTQGTVFMDSRAMGWNYQTFGVWGTDQSLGGTMSAFSSGAPTPGSSVPATGSAAFAGFAMGVYVDPAGTGAATLANMNATVSFTNRSIAFATTNTIVNNSAGQAPAPGLNLGGTFTYSAGSSQFNGTVTTANGTLAGTSTGQFYGPAAEEIGGTYSLSGSGSLRMMGAYGGKR